MQPVRVCALAAAPAGFMEETDKETYNEADKELARIGSEEEYGGRTVRGGASSTSGAPGTSDRDGRQVRHERRVRHKRSDQPEHDGDWDVRGVLHEWRARHKQSECDRDRHGRHEWREPAQA